MNFPVIFVREAISGTVSEREEQRGRLSHAKTSVTKPKLRGGRAE